MPALILPAACILPIAPAGSREPISLDGKRMIACPTPAGAGWGHVSVQLNFK